MFIYVCNHSCVNFEERAREVLRQQAEADERDRLGAERVRASGLELVRFLTAHRIASVSLHTTPGGAGATRGWVIFRRSHEEAVASGVWGLALTRGGYLYHCCDLYTPSETHLADRPLASLTSLESRMMDEAAAEVLVGSFGPTIDQKENSRNSIIIGCLIVVVALFLLTIVLPVLLSGR